MNEFTKTKIHFTLALLGALFALHPFLKEFEDNGFWYHFWDRDYFLKLSYAYLLVAGLLALCVYFFGLTLVTERPHSWLERLGNYCYGLAIMALPFYGGLYLASLLAAWLGQSHLAWAAPGAALGLGVGWLALSQLLAWLLRGRLGAHDRSAKLQQLAGQEVKALADAQELFAGDHYDLAVMQAYRAVDARLRRVLLSRGANVPAGDPDRLIAAAKRARILSPSLLALLQELNGQVRIAVSSEPLTRAQGTAALSATRHVLASVPLPEPAGER